MKKGPVNEALKPLAWLLGTWRSTTGEGSYPTIQPFKFGEEIVFESFGQPLLSYSSRTWHPDGKPAHFESGFLRIKPKSSQVALMVGHNFGITTLEEGSVEGSEVRVKTTNVGRMGFAKEPAVTAIERVFRLVEGGDLEVSVFMETAKTPLTLHIRTRLRKCGAGDN